MEENPWTFNIFDIQSDKNFAIQRYTKQTTEAELINYFLSQNVH